MFCTYMPNNNNNQIGNQNFKIRNSNNKNHSSTDIIYASFMSGRSTPSQQNCPYEDEVSCFDSNECIKKKNWCDSLVDCSDGSDESACSCKDRLSKARFCDGYADCPAGEDEIGCFGCGEFMFSCYYSRTEYHMANRSTVSMCYSSLEKCDGIANCLNGRDEIDCNIIMSENAETPSSFGVSYTEGLLYRNYKGEWFPVCNNAMKWAKEACKREIGLNTNQNPILKFVSKAVGGPFIEPSNHGVVQFPQSCQKQENNEISDHLVYVKCPEMMCGIPTPVNPKTLGRHRKSLDNVDRTKREKEEERIVGGGHSKPQQWPFIISIYRDGHFHCGGVIYNEEWVSIFCICIVISFLLIST